MKLNTSNVKAIPHIVKQLVDMQPTSIIDIGCGSGKYGFMCREYLPNLKILDGIDPVENSYLKVIYDYYWKEKLQDHLFSKYDLGLMIEMIYWFNFDQMKEIYLSKLKQNINHFLITFETDQHGGMVQWDIDHIKEIFGNPSLIKTWEGEMMVII